MKKIKVELTYWLMRFFALFPLGFHYFWADVIAWILEHLLRYRRDVICMNLSRSFPELRSWEIKPLIKEYYKHMAEIVVEAIWFGGCDLERLRKSGICTITNLDTLTNLYGDSKSVIVMYSHCGNWELLGGIPAYGTDSAGNTPFGYENTFFVYKQLHNEVSDEIFKRNRIAPMPGFKGLLEANQILRFCLKNKDNKALYCYAADQYPYVGSHDIGTFLHQPTKTMLGSIGIAHKMGMGVVYMKMNRVRRGHYDIEFIPICTDASQMDQIAILRKYFDLLEEEIKANPVNWLWSHNRWK